MRGEPGREARHAGPAQVAGHTGGLLTTTQQAAPVLGVALIGGLFTGVAPRLGWTSAFGVAVLMQAVAAVAFVLLARRLRRGSGPSAPSRVGRPSRPGLRHRTA